MRGMVKSQFSGGSKKLFKALGIAVGIVLLLLFMTPFTSSTLMVDEAMAAGPAAQQGSGKMMGGGQGGKGGKGDQTAGSRSGAKGMKDAVLADEGDDDSDAPEWAKGNRDANPHAQGGGPPAGSGTKKGDDYGDLWVVVRDPSTGEPELDINGNVQPILTEAVIPVLDENGNPVLDENGNPVYTNVLQLTEDGEVPVNYETYLQEVEFGRLSSSRSPNKVSDKALEEVLNKLDLVIPEEGEIPDGIITVDTAGRLVIDGATVDSPLENLALYEALIGGTLDDKYTAVLPVDKLTLAASLLAAAADKSGEITLDLVFYQNAILGLTGTPDTPDYIDYSGLTYDRSVYDEDYTYFYYVGTVPTADTINLKSYLEYINGTLPTGAAAIFAAAADDALKIIELIHDEVRDEQIIMP